MDFVSPSESAPTPSFILCISESFSQRGRNFLPIGVEFRNLSVLRSGVQLNYVTWGSCQNTGLFSVSNHETTRGNLMSRYLRLETPVHMCFTKEGCQGGYTFHITFLVIWILIFQQEAGEKPPSDPLYLGLSDVHTLAEGQLVIDLPSIFPIACHRVSHLLFFFSLEHPPGYITERGSISGQIRSGRVRQGAVFNYHGHDVHQGFVLFCWVGMDSLLRKAGWLVS